MSKRAKEKAELIANGIMISVQGKTGRVVYNTKEKSFTHYELMCAAQKGYEQGEKDTITRIREQVKQWIPEKDGEEYTCGKRLAFNTILHLLEEMEEK